MPKLDAHFADLLTQAERIAATGPISPAGRWAFRGISAAVADLPPAARGTAIWTALGRLAEDDPTTALHGLAAMIRARWNATITARPAA